MNLLKASPFDPITPTRSGVFKGGSIAFAGDSKSKEAKKDPTGKRANALEEALKTLEVSQPAVFVREEEDKLCGRWYIPSESG